MERAVGVLEVNCYEVDPSAGVRGFYPLASLLSHSCVANCRTVWAGRAGDWAASTWAATDIQVGGGPALPSCTAGCRRGRRW